MRNVAAARVADACLTSVPLAPGQTPLTRALPRESTKSRSLCATRRPQCRCLACQLADIHLTSRLTVSTTALSVFFSTRSSSVARAPVIIAPTCNEMLYEDSHRKAEPARRALIQLLNTRRKRLRGLIEVHSRTRGKQYLFNVGAESQKLGLDRHCASATRDLASGTFELSCA